MCRDTMLTQSLTSPIDYRYHRQPSSSTTITTDKYDSNHNETAFFSSRLTSSSYDTPSNISTSQPSSPQLSYLSQRSYSFPSALHSMPSHLGWCQSCDSAHFAIAVCPLNNDKSSSKSVSPRRIGTPSELFYCTRIHYQQDPIDHAHHISCCRAHSTQPSPSPLAYTPAPMSFYQAQSDLPSGADHSGTQHPHLPSAGSFVAQSEQLNFYSMFGDLLVPEEGERYEALKRIEERLIEATKEVVAERTSGVTSTDSMAAQLLQSHLPSVLRLALACPLQDISSHMRQLLHDITAIDSQHSKYVAALDCAFQPSAFVPLSSCVDPTGQTAFSPVQSLPSSASSAATAATSSSSACSDVNNLMEDIFLSTGRISHIDLLMAWHPSFLTAYTTVMHHVMDGEGPLVSPWRNYLAIMAAARHQCDYLVSLQETEYLLKGGDPSWLRGIAHAPKKLQALCELNALLAHQPWLITKSHIAALLQVHAGTGRATDSWSVAELVHALVILATFHSLSGFAFGMGLRKEIDCNWEKWELSKTATTPASSAQRSSSTAGVAPSTQSTSSAAAQSSSLAATPHIQSSTSPNVTDGEHLLRLLASDASVDLNGTASGNAFNRAEDLVVKEGSSPSHSNASRSAGTPRGPSDLHIGEGVTSGSGLSASTSITGLNTAMRGLQVDNSATAKYISVSTQADSPNSSAAPGQLSASKIAAMKYANFDVNSKQYSIFFLHDYSWKEHGFALVNRFYVGLAQMLDLEWDTIFQLTYNTVNDKTNIDTTPFRRAIWYYTARLFGLSHDDYDYNKIPIFLSTSLKTYVKKIVCAPETITQADYELKGYNFAPSEKCHIVCLAFEARRQASLLYALHSLMNFMVNP